MKLLGIPLRRPGANELTAASIMAVGLWVAAIGLTRVALVAIDRSDAGALLLVLLWACISARLGIRVGMGGRHLAVNLLVSALLLGIYESALTLTA